VSWRKQLQKTTALSTTAAEIIVTSDVAKELFWLKRILLEPFSNFAWKTPVMYIDKASVIKLTKNPEYLKISKHI
jgi:hypothetical protein